MRLQFLTNSMVHEKAQKEGLMSERKGYGPRRRFVCKNNGRIAGKKKGYVAKWNSLKENGRISGKKERFVTKRKGWCQTETFDGKKEGFEVKMNVEIKFSIEVTKIMSSQ